MNSSRIFLILLARYRIILFTLIVTVLTTLVISLLLPKSYKSTATLLLSHKGADPVTGALLPAPLISGFMPTQLDVIKSTRTALMVVDQLKLVQNETAKQRYEESNSDLSMRDWMAALLLKNLDVETTRDSSVIGISYKATDPWFAATIANAFANAYQEINIRLTVEPSQKAAAYFTEQLNTLRDRVEAAQGKLSHYQHEKGILDVDARLDIETRRLNDLSSQLVIAQAEIMGASDANNSQSQRDRAAVTKDAIVNSLKLNLAQVESKFSEISQKLGRNHPSYESTKSEVEQLRAELQKSIKEAASTAVNRVAEIRSSLKEQREKVLALNQARDELNLLVRDMEGAQQAYNSAMLRLNQTSLEGQSNLSSVSMLDVAKVPDKPDSPKILLNLVLSLILGTLLGLGFGLLVEMIDRRIRCAEDLIDSLQVPVLGIIKQGISDQQNKKRLPLIWPRLLRKE